MIRPTSHRILIQPDEQPERDGLIELPQHLEFVATSGTVIAIGPRGSKVRYEARQRALRDAASAIEQLDFVDGILRSTKAAILNGVLKLIGTSDPEHELHVGDRVAFDSESGLRITENGTEYLILNEDDVVVIVDESEAVA